MTSTTKQQNNYVFPLKPNYYFYIMDYGTKRLNMSTFLKKYPTVGTIYPAKEQNYSPPDQTLAPK